MMTLFVDQSGFPLSVETNLFEIVGGDGGFGDTPVLGDPTVVQITYAQSSSGFGQNFLNTLVNTLGNSIVVTGVDSSFVVGGTPITNLAGVTLCDGAILRVIYDTTQCGGSGYFVFDINGNQITFPSFILVGHELSHTLHIAVGDHACPDALDAAGVAAAEVLAETDENSLRAQYGITLRDVNNHAGGCGFAGVPPSSISCFIVSAAYGSPRAPEVRNFIRLRDVFLRETHLGDAFFTQLFGEYYQFSPRIAAHMEQSPRLKSAIATLLVAPLLDFYGLLERYLRGAWNDERFVTDVMETLTRFRADLRMAGHGGADARLIAHQLTRLSARLGRQQMGRKATVGFPELPPADDVASVLTYLATAVEATTPSAEHFTWAVLDPLALCWSCIRRLDDERVSLPALAVDFVGELESWIGAAPLPGYLELSDPAEVAADLARLAETVFVTPRTRQVFATRLLQQYGDRVPYDLGSTLAELGYAHHVMKREEALHAR